MSIEMVDYFRKIYQEIDFPSEVEITPQARTMFFQAMDFALMYRGHPNILLGALQRFVETGCRPLAYAGASRILKDAAYLSGYDYDAYGLDVAREWLAIARLDIPTCFEIELVQMNIEIGARNPDAMRSCLKLLSNFGNEGHSYYVALMAMHYFRVVKDPEKRGYWAQLAEKRAQNDLQRLYVLNADASEALENQDFRKAIQKFEQAIAINKQDPWAWHNMSVAYLHLDDLPNAERCNEIALVLMDFGAARHVRELIAQSKRGNLVKRFRNLLFPK
ncbi:MAG: hypothetical protein OHK0046_35170 [Anaerolineae bacterium]